MKKLQITELLNLLFKKYTLLENKLRTAGGGMGGVMGYWVVGIKEDT